MRPLCMLIERENIASKHDDTGETRRDLLKVGPR